MENMHKIFNHPEEIRLVAASFLIASLVSGCIEVLLWASSKALRNELLIQALMSNPFLFWSCLISVLGLIYGAWRSEPGSRSRLAWGIMALAQASDFIGNLFWPAESVPQYGRFFSAADIYFLAFYLLFVVGILLIPTARLKMRDRIKVLLDMGIVAITATMILWAFFIWPILGSRSEMAAPALAIDPGIDILLLFGLLKLHFHGMEPAQRIPMAILSCSVLADIIGDMIFVYQSIQREFVPGGLVDFIWIVCYLLIGLAGIWHAEASHARIKSGDIIQLQPPWTQHLPSISIVLAYLLLARAYGPDLHDPFFLLLIEIGGVIALVTVRQFVTLNENKSLNRAAQEEISQRKAAEERYRNLVDNSLQGLIIVQDEAVTFVNQAMAEMTGYSVVELTSFLARDLRVLIHEDDFESMAGLYHECLDNPDTPIKCDFAGIRKDGSLAWYEVRISGVNYSGRSAIQATFIDITERKLAEEALAQNEKRYRNLFENAPVSIWELDISPATEYLNAISASGAVDLGEHFKAHPEDVGMCISLIRVLDTNAMSLKIFQSESKEELISRFEESVLPESFRSFEEELLGLADGKIIPDGEMPIRTMKGERRVIYRKSLAVPGYSDAISRILITVMDITERITMEDALKEKEAKYRRLVEGSPDVIYSYSSKRGGMFYSSRVQSILGYSPDHMVKNPHLWRDLIHPEDLDRVMAAITSITPEKNLDVEYRLKDSKGRLHWINDRSINRHIIGDEVITEGLATDITERKIAEEMLLASLKEKEILLKEVHHRVKNNLQVVSSLLRLQSRRVMDKDASEAFRESQNRITSMSIIHEMLYQSPDMSRIRFDNYARSLIRFLRSSYGPAGGIEFEFDMEDVMLDLNKAIPCGLIINELLSNCMKHAFPEGRNGHVWIKMHAHGEGDIVLTVKDDGIGLPEDMDLRMKQSLGMILIKSLVAQIKGRMEVDCNGGTEFKIVFPAGL